MSLPKDNAAHSLSLGRRTKMKAQPNSNFARNASLLVIIYQHLDYTSVPLRSSVVTPEGIVSSSNTTHCVPVILFRTVVSVDFFRDMTFRGLVRFERMNCEWFGHRPTGDQITYMEEGEKQSPLICNARSSAEFYRNACVFRLCSCSCIRISIEWPSAVHLAAIAVAGAFWTVWVYALSCYVAVCRRWISLRV